MPRPRTVSELLGRGVVFEAHEAVAVAQQLILNPSGDALVPPYGPPTADTIEICANGSVACPHSDATPAISEIGDLLDVMLPHGAFTRVPGGLRYTIARARNEVDAPPFDSLIALSTTLERYERGERKEVVRRLV